MSYVALLEELHADLRPRAYLQLGLDRSDLLGVARCGAIGVAPDPRIGGRVTAEKPWVKLYAMEPGAFLAQESPESTLEGAPLDLVVVEGGLSTSELARILDRLTPWAHAGTQAVILAGENDPEGLAAALRGQGRDAQVRHSAEGATAAIVVAGFGANGRTRHRSAVVFAWFVPPGMPELGDYYLRLLRAHHADSKLFIGMNHGSDPVWEGAIRASGLDVEVRWARPEIGDYWDATGFIAALEGFSQSEDSFGLVWFAHTKGGSLSRFDQYAYIRGVLEERFWNRRSFVEGLFDDPEIGIFAPHFCPLPPAYYARELYALMRVYRDRFAPLGLHARDTFYVMRAEIVRRFCDAVGEVFFRTAPGEYDAGRYLFEVGFPSIATMQGYEPFIDPDVPGDNDPREDVWIAYDVKQNHRLAGKELARWRADRTRFRPREMGLIGHNVALLGHS